MTHSHFSIDQSSFLGVVFVFLRKKSCLLLFEEEEQKPGFLSPKKKMADKIYQSCRAVSEPYPKSLTYYLVNDTPRGVSDTYITRVPCVPACPHVRHTDTPQGCRIRASDTPATIFLQKSGKSGNGLS